MEQLAPGFLIAMPQLGDGNFHRSVVLIHHHGPEGARGLVLNKPGPVTLGEVAQGQSMSVAPVFAPQTVFLGGPVESQRGFVLHDRAGIPERQRVAAGLYLSETVEALALLLADGSAPLRFFLGYAGWGPRQLERELASGAWLFTEAAPNRVLRADPETLWDETIRQMGVDPAMLQVARGVN